MRFPRQLAAALLAMLPLLASAEQLTVSAAASLTDAFNAIGPLFEKIHPGVEVRFNFAASGVLLQQIRQGAPVDVLASADQDTVARGIDAQLLDAGTKRDFAANTVVLIVPADSTPAVKTLADLSSAAVRRIALGKPTTVPVGRYTQQALETAKLWGPLEPKFVEADSVRQVLDYVSRGEAEAGFVYRTDAVLVPAKVRIVLTVEGHEPVTYPVITVKASQQQPLANDFIGFLFTHTARKVLAQYGFENY
jgi:molybdate transport system substrate-binding protein